MIEAEATSPFFMEKAEVMRILDEVNTRIGFIPDPNATAEQAQSLMLAQGIRPEDNIGSCGIIAAREAE